MDGVFQGPSAIIEEIDVPEVRGSLVVAAGERAEAHALRGSTQSPRRDLVHSALMRLALWRRDVGAACVVSGPGDIAHAVDEHVSLDEVGVTARVLEAAARNLLLYHLTASCDCRRRRRQADELDRGAMTLRRCGPSGRCRW